jgi:hypothetical protein
VKLSLLILASAFVSSVSCQQTPSAVPVEPRQAPPPVETAPSDADISSSADAAIPSDALASDVAVDNSAKDCIDVTATTTAVGSRLIELTFSVLVRKNTGGCGCVSALLRYRLLRGEGSSLAQLATGTINSFKHSAKPFTATRRIAKMGAPYTLSVSCDGG